MIFSGTILSTTSDVRAVKYTVCRVMVYKETLSGRLLDKARYLSNKMYGERFTVFPLNHFHYCFKLVIAWQTPYVLFESSTLSVTT